MAAVTVVKDEAVMLPRWVQHYGERLGVDHLVVIDNDSRDGSTDDLAAEVRAWGELPGGSGFDRGRLQAANQIGRELLERFDWVIFTDADEFLVVDPQFHDSFKHLLAVTSGAAVAPLALNVVQDLEAEGALDPTRAVLEQRSYAQFAEVMCKPSSKRLPIRWAHASHGLHGEYAVRSDLFLLHLKFADLDRLRLSAAHRHALHLRDGRGGGSWQIDDVAERFEARMRGSSFETAEEFDPAGIDLDALVVRQPGGHTWRTPKVGQLRSLDEEAVVRIPSRLRGSL
ncbi:hypothetical protein BH09ACT12_BH09ACT12_11150 [soil metagenome]